MDRVVTVMLGQIMLVTVLLSPCLVRSEKEKPKERRPLTSTVTPLAFSTMARSSSIPSEEVRLTPRTSLGQEEHWPIREMIAILGETHNHLFCVLCVTDLAAVGGVLGFWGGVGLMGTIFLLVLVTQRCCSRRSVMEKKEVTLTIMLRQHVGNIILF